MSVKDNRLVDEPVGLYEVAQLIDCPSLDVGSVCTNDNVNKWSKYKPMQVQSADDGPGDPGDVARDLVDWGLRFSRFTSPLQMTLNLDNLAWKWRKPTTWFRLTDFIGYDHKAGKFFPEIDSNALIEVSSQSSVHIPTENAIISVSGFGAKDFQMGGTAEMSIADAYLGVMIKRDNSTTYEWYTNMVKGLFRPLEITIPNLYSNVQRGNIVATAWLFASSVYLTGSSANGQFIGLDDPVGKRITFMARYNRGSMIVYAKMVEQSVRYNTIDFEIVFKADGNEVSFSGIVASLNRSNNYGSLVNTQIGFTKSLPDVTVKNGESYTYDSTVFRNSFTNVPVEETTLYVNVVATSSVDGRLHSWGMPLMKAPDIT